MIRRLLLLAGAVFLIAAAEPPEKPVTLSPEDAAKEGKALVEEILSMKPRENSTNGGTMTVRKPRNGGTEKILVRFEVLLTPTNWLSIYSGNSSINGTNVTETLTVAHTDNQPNGYSVDVGHNGSRVGFVGRNGKSFETNSFARSDFWIADLGLEFFHWPTQHLTKKEMNRSRFCRVLESINPKPEAGGYSKVVSWIDNESDGIVQADAYDDKGKLLKQFFPKDFKKVEGVWQLKEMQISNVQTGSKTTIEFDLN